MRLALARHFSPIGVQAASCGKIAIEIGLKRAHLCAAERMMSRNLVILLVVLSLGIAGLIVFSNLRSKPDTQLAAAQPVVTPPPAAPKPAPTIDAGPRPPLTFPSRPALTGGVMTVTRPPAGQTPVLQAPVPVPVQATNDPDLEVKPLPVLEKQYTATTNRDDRLDIMMDIAESPGAEAVKTLTRLFEAETDPDLKVDLLDSLLGIEGFKDEKLIMLTMGSRQGLPDDVRQSAIDGLIDLDDQRVIPVLNGLLNDPNEEIRESAKDAIEMLQAEPAVQIK